MNWVVSVLEAALLPELERRRTHLAQDPQYSDVQVVSLRHAEAIHTIGLKCHPISAPNVEDCYGLHVSIIGLSGMSLRGFVVWHQMFVADRLPGYTIHEAMTRPCQLDSHGRCDDFLAMLPGLFRSFERGLKRGRPPSALRQRWNSFVFGRE